jgi:hypothetical protein
VSLSVPVSAVCVRQAAHTEETQSLQTRISGLVDENDRYKILVDKLSKQVRSLSLPPPLPPPLSHTHTPRREALEASPPREYPRARLLTYPAHLSCSPILLT